MPTLDRYLDIFPEDIYDVQSPFSSLRNLLQCFLDEIEETRSRLLLDEIQKASEDVQFFHLDRLFGDLLRFPRLSNEIYQLWQDDLDPYINIVSDSSFEEGNAWVFGTGTNREKSLNAYHGNWISRIFC